MTETRAQGLRARKRRSTRQAIERGAVDLALKHGYDHVTVEMICDVAVISQRTFFNYAGSKEGAVLGIELPLPGEALRAAYVAGRGGSPLEDLLQTLAAALTESGSADPELFRKRRQIIEANPVLAIKEFARMEEAQNTVASMVRERLQAEAGMENGHEEESLELNEDARMTVVLSFALMHFCAGEWTAGGASVDLGPILAEGATRAHRIISA
uniref:TetR/AcrR family transcriptional regulator n=1 Tax=Arthrobacter sp. TaxID=1667 RepID=UPI000EB67E74|nr:TetR/AcrR family transcriptional regulator [Arthrobacter sp.]AXV46250.1 transcriptional regulator, TetR family [Arthrobacter sp.]